MEFNKLRLTGFKSFVEPTEFLIEPGLTGVVGPNGCGKSNLVEALRWVMGENSYKNMRASSMDDVIFSGSGSRPSRNMAEVALHLDNSDHTAPAAFNDAEELQVARRIEREAGSVYRINGKDVRAKDVQLLFADVSTGARSPSMIGQGRIGELISAKPQARRALLEEAAGISGLHSRRHEAELRLRAAETNLERLEDVIAQLDSQLESLKRQARQATRYRTLAGDIRRAEATILHLRWSAARQAVQEAEKVLTASTVTVGETQLVQTEAAKAQAIIASKLPGLREAEAKAAAVLQHQTIKRDQLDEEARRAQRRKSELTARVSQLEADITREEEMIAENSDILAHLQREEAELTRQTGEREDRETATRQAMAEATDKLREIEGSLSDSTSRLANARAERDRLSRQQADAERRLASLGEQSTRTDADLAEVNREIAEQSDVQEKADRANYLEASFSQSVEAVKRAEAAAEEAQIAERASRDPVAAARQEVNRIETEAKTLSRIVNSAGGDLFAAIIEKVKVEHGFERALGAAMGDDLELPADASAPAHWTIVSTSDLQPLPTAVRSMADVVKAPPELAARLSQIGIVDAADGARLAAELKPGQRLVSVAGDLWRWDGLRASAEAPTAAAIRLEQKNRLAELDREAIEALKEQRARESEAEAAAKTLETAREKERLTRETMRKAQSSLDGARKEVLAAERQVSVLASRRSALTEARQRITESETETREALEAARVELSGLADLAELEVETDKLRQQAEGSRATLAEHRAAHEGLARENAMRQQRLEAITRERTGWNERAIKADRQIRVLRERLEKTLAEQQKLFDAPEDIDERRRKIVQEIEKAEAERRAAGDALAEMENDQREADKVAVGALQALSDARQEAARAEERLTAARERQTEIAARIREDLDCEPHLAAKAAELDEGVDLPDITSVERRLEKLKAERERLGAVNLRAEEEQNEIRTQRDELVSERDDLIEAIKRLRQGIQSLNKEGRERLLVAFDAVNAQFQKLFTHLFNGGTAELQLVESDDPLEAGLEIMARPPGKKPQTMTLLSGGEQALTAMALIFAVFLTNPAPICVLDEVDAPLDDHNVERFCNLMDQMSAETDTRFVIITHNPITMARMNRLFGVTMAERGVSQLVSVDLETAESFREAG